MLDLAKRMDSKADDQIEVILPEGRGFKSEKRIFDLEARYLSDVIAEKSELLGRLAKWIAGAGKQADNVVGGHPHKFELKTGDKNLSTSQSHTDDLIRANEDIANELGIGGIDNLRMHTKDVPMQFVIDDLPRHLNRWVDEDKLSLADKNLLLRAMRQMHANGTSTMSVENYATLLVRLSTATVRRTDVEPDNGPAPIPDNIP